MKPSKNFVFIHLEKLVDWGRGKRREGSKSQRLWGVIGCWLHDMRLIITKNAKSELKPKNEIVCAETKWKLKKVVDKSVKGIVSDPKFIAKKAKALISKKGVTARDDQVKVAMLMLAVSPQYLRDGDVNQALNKEKVGRWKQGTIEYLTEKFGERLLAVVFHEDEQNPHASAYIVPLLEKEVKQRGRPKKIAKKIQSPSKIAWSLCCKDMFTPDTYTYQEPNLEKKKIDDDDDYEQPTIKQGTCSQMQDEYAEALIKLKLEVRRGVRHRGPQPALAHETNKERYRKLTDPVKFVEGLSDKDLRDWAAKWAPLVEEAGRAKRERNYYQCEAGNAQELVEELKKALAAYQRTLPVAEVIRKLTGLDPRPEPEPEICSQGKKRCEIELEFLLPNGLRIGILAGNKFTNLTPEIPFAGSKCKRMSGRGALDAVTLITGWSFKETSDWIADNFSNSEAAKAAAENIADEIDESKDDPARLSRRNHAEKLVEELESADESQWPLAFKTLTKKFHFHAEQLQRMHDSRWIDANRFGHVLFLKVIDGPNKMEYCRTGTTVIDLKNPEAPVLETGETGFFLDIDPHANHGVLCASVLDALALTSMPEHFKSCILVVGKNLDDRTKKVIGQIVKTYKGNTVLAENLTTIGTKLAAWFTEKFPDMIKLRLPGGCRNWIDHHLQRHIQDQSKDNQSPENPDKSNPS